MKPRNYVVVAFLKAKRKSGAHQKSKKAIRRQDKIDLMKKIDSKGRIKDSAFLI